MPTKTTERQIEFLRIIADCTLIIDRMYRRIEANMLSADGRKRAENAIRKSLAAIRAAEEALR